MDPADPVLSVLFVDDDEDLLIIARLFLEKSGDIRVTSAASARGALDSPLIGTYDAIVSDYLMEGMDGIGFLKAVRASYGDIPFIFFTGKGREEVFSEAIDNGADYILEKSGEPALEFAELTRMIRLAVEKRWSRKERDRPEEMLPQ